MFPPVKKYILCCPLTWKYTDISVYNCFGLFSLVNSAWSVYIYLLIQTRQLFLMEKAILWIEDLKTEVKNALKMDLFITDLQLFTSQDVNWWSEVKWITCGLLWCFYQLFGLWRHPFTANISKSIPLNRNSTHLAWSEDEYIFSKWLFLGELLL